MIVNYTIDGWQIITQRSHGLLAAQICAHWKKDNQPVRWVDTLIATAEHDDVFNELENDDLLNEIGGPVNFKMTNFRKDYCERLIRMAETKSAYIALLVSRHIQFVHGEMQAAKAYCRSLRKQEKIWIRSSGSSKEEVQQGYELLEFCDAFSLLICQGLIQPEHRKIEISNGPDGTPYEMYAVNDDELIVVPWPFEPDSFYITYESKTIAQLKFKNLKQFRKMMTDAETVTHRLTVTSGR